MGSSSELQEHMQPGHCMMPEGLHGLPSALSKNCMLLEPHFHSVSLVMLKYRLTIPYPNTLRSSMFIIQIYLLSRKADFITPYIYLLSIIPLAGFGMVPCNQIH